MDKCPQALSLFWRPLTQILFPWLAVVVGLAVAVIILYCLLVKTRSKEAYGIIATFVSIGALLGITAGASKTPVIGTFLPALITLIAAVIGYLFTRDGLVRWRPLIPFCVMGMMVASVVNMFVGTSINELSRSYERQYDVWLLEKK